MPSILDYSWLEQLFGLLTYPKKKLGQSINRDNKYTRKNFFLILLHLKILISIFN